MVRVRETFRSGLSVALGAILGAALVVALAGGTAAAGPAPPQDPAVQMQIQQALSNFQIQLQNRLNQMQSRIDVLEREQQNARFQRDLGSAGSSTSTAPTAADPIPGITTYGRLKSLANESQRFELQASRGDLLAQLAMTSDGPGLILFDASGQISVALLATPRGPELRMVDADGTLQTVVSGQ